MAEVVLFHSVLGLRLGVIAAADRLRVAGHTVHTPDLYDGEVFDDLERWHAQRGRARLPRDRQEG
jgi:dienelactone hydrolase